MILDTNALSGFAKGEAAVAEKIRRAKVIAVPVVAVGEYRFGIAQSRFRTEFEQWLLELLAASRLLLVDAETAAHYAGVRLELKRAGTPIPVNDCWIAALCRQHALPVLSQDRHVSPA
ncbi:MAG: type II toxin-antitoxin system VapC family toxin [Acidobacteria bacterium]|nr:type II toxin-antitoxin system VapC family toxin [Acidobacteriota bacterium]